MKKKVVKYSLLALLIILAAFSQTLSMKAEAQRQCRDSRQHECISDYRNKGRDIQHSTESGLRGDPLLILKKEFPPVKFLQIPVAILFGIVTNAVYYHVLVFEIHYFVQDAVVALSI